MGAVCEASMSTDRIFKGSKRGSEDLLVYFKSNLSALFRDNAAATVGSSHDDNHPFQKFWDADLYEEYDGVFPDLCSKWRV